MAGSISNRYNRLPEIVLHAQVNLFGISACVTLNKNEMYDWYHGGAFGKEHTGRWSCCNSEKNSKGCKEATNKASQRSRASSFSQQWKNGNPSLEVAAMDGDMSSSMLTHSNWGEDDTTLYHERYIYSCTESASWHDTYTD